MSKKVLKILFIISFLPYVFIILYGIFNAFNGTSFMFDTIDGFSAFFLTALFMLYLLVIEIPIIPCCLIFQICYILRKKVNRFKNIKAKKYVKICCAIGIILLMTIFLCFHTYEIGKFFEKNSAKQMIKKADEKIAINESTFIFSGIFHIPEYRCNHLFIDYNKMEVGFLLNSSYDMFWKVRLHETTRDSVAYKHIINDYNMQADISLKSPGKRFVSFYDEDTSMPHSIAFLLILEDGTIYYVDNLREKNTNHNGYTGLNWSKFFVGEDKKFNY